MWNFPEEILSMILQKQYCKQLRKAQRNMNRGSGMDTGKVRSANIYIFLKVLSGEI
jgi:hypothetical protein